MGSPADTWRAIMEWLQHPMSWVLLAIFITLIIIDHYQRKE